MYGIKSRHEGHANEKCPRCLNIFQDFIDIGNGLLGCYKCGCVFVSKDIRDNEYAHKKERVLDINKERTCPECGKVCRNKFGLTSHLKSHKNDSDIIR